MWMVALFITCMLLLQACCFYAQKIICVLFFPHCILSWKGSWEDYLPLTVFAYNNSCQASIKMSLWWSIVCTQVYFPHCWNVVGERCLVGSDWVQQTHDKVWKIRQNLLTAQSRQKSYADVRWRDLEFLVGDKVLLKVSQTKAVFILALVESSARDTLDHIWLLLELEP
jgi:hypothetical protein